MSSEPPVAHRVVNFVLPAGFPSEVQLARDLKIHYRILGSSQARTEEVFAWPRQARDILAADLARQEPNVDELPFFAVDKAAKRITILPGHWEVQESVLIPA